MLMYFENANVCNTEMHPKTSCKSKFITKIKLDLFVFPQYSEPYQELYLCTKIQTPSYHDNYVIYLVYYNITTIQ